MTRFIALIALVLFALHAVAQPRVDALGDPLPDGAIARLGSVRHRPGGTVPAIAWAPDGQRLAVWVKAWAAGLPDRLIIADARTGRELRVVDLPQCNMLAVRWLADGRGLAVLRFAPEEVGVWELTDEKARPPSRDNAQTNFLRAGAFTHAAISPDGQWLATTRFGNRGQQRAIELWPAAVTKDLKKAEPRELGRLDGNAMQLVFSPDSRHVAVLVRGDPPAKPPVPAAPGGRLLTFEIKSGKRVAEFDAPLPAEHSPTLPPVLAFSRDGKKLYLGDEKDIIHAFDWAAGCKTATFNTKPDPNPAPFARPGITALAVPRDGVLLAASRTTGLIAWDVTKSPPEPAPLAPAKRRFEHVVSSPDGTRLAVANATMIGTDVRVIDARTGAEWSQPAPGHSSFVYGVAMTRDGTVVTAGPDRSVRWWDPRTGKELRCQSVEEFDAWTDNSPLTADGRALFVKDGEHIAHFDLETERKTRVSDEKLLPMAVRGISGSMLFFGSADGKVRQWDAVTKRVRQTYDERNPGGMIEMVPPFGQVTMSPDGKRVVLCSLEVTRLPERLMLGAARITVCDTATGEVRRHWQAVGVRMQSHAWSPDGRHLLMGGWLDARPGGAAPASPLPVPSGTGLVLFDGGSGEPLRALQPDWGPKPAGAAFAVTALAFSPDGKFFALAQNDTSVQVYELATGQVCHSFRGHRHQIAQLALADSGRRLISVSYDTTGLVWDTSFANLAKPAELDADHAWGALGPAEWATAGPAMAKLAAKPDELIALVREKLKPAAKAEIDPAAMVKLVEKLDAAAFAERERAAAALAKLGREALPLLQDHLAKTSSAEAQRRLPAILRTLIALPMPKERLREIRVVALLEQAGADSAKAELKRLATGHPDAPLTRDAAAALMRKESSDQ